MQSKNICKSVNLLKYVSHGWFAEAWLVSRTSSNRSISSINSLSSSTSGLSTSSASGWSAVSNTSGAMSR